MHIFKWVNSTIKINKNSYNYTMMIDIFALSTNE